MSNMQDLTKLLMICETRYAQTQQEFTKLCAEEHRLRAEIDRLSSMGQQAQVPTVEVAEMRAIGADVIWQGWLGRAKTALNMSLAQILAAKESHIGEVRTAYGKLLMVKKLLSDMKMEKRKNTNNIELANAIEMSVQMLPPNL